MDLRLGACGWSLAERKGTFYPAGTKDELTCYASRFDTVEIDSTAREPGRGRLVAGTSHEIHRF